MSLSPDLVAQFVKITNDNKKQDTKKENITYGIVQEVHGDEAYIKLDGSKPRYYAVTYDAENEKYILTSNIIEYPTNYAVTEKVGKVLDRTKTELDVNSYIVGEETKYFTTIVDDQMLPATSTVSVAMGDRVIVMIKNHSAVITGNLGNPATTTKYVDGETGKIQKIADDANNKATEANNKVAEFGIVIADVRVDTEELTAEVARIKNLETDSLLTKTIKANEGDISDLKSDNVTISGKVEAAEGDIKNLQSENASISKRLETAEAVISGTLTADQIEAKFATINELETERGRIDVLSSDVAEIDTLTSEFISGKTVTSEFSNSVVSQVGDAQIKSAMIKDIDAGKIQSGSIDTNKVNIQSDDGSFVIANNRLQIKEGETVRVQIGKDGNGNYSVSICDTNGNVIFSEDGITEDGIPDNIIINDMVSDNANIHASKLDIDSLFEEINSDGTNVIKSTKITVDEQGQTLDAKLTTLATKASVDGLNETVSSQGTQISANTEAISTKVSQQELQTAKDEINQTTTNLSTQYSALDQKVDGISTTVSSHTSQISNKADKSTVTTVNNKVTSLEQDLSGFKTTVSDTYATKTKVSEVEDEINQTATNLSTLNQEVDEISATVSSHTSQIAQKADNTTVTSVSNKVTSLEQNLSGFKTTVSSTYATKTEIEQTTDDLSEQIATKASSNSVTETNNKVTSLEQNLSGFKTTVSSTYVTKTEMEQTSDDISEQLAAKADNSIVTSLEQEVSNFSDEVSSRVTTAESLIEQLSHSISMLVTDGNGTSLMTQTDTGWMFSTEDIQNAVNRISEDLSTLTDDVGNVDNTVSILQQAVDDLGILGEYIQITTYEDEPCIELGELDSDFKLRITNTRMMFTEGSVVLAYFTNQSFHSKKIVVEEELQQGKFVWKVRSNGNLGLVWVGASGLVDLTGTTWVFNESIYFGDYGFINMPEKLKFSLNFTSLDGFSCIGLNFAYDWEYACGESIIAYALEDDSEMFAYDSWEIGGWKGSETRVITFTGGADATNPELIAILQAIATKQ